MGKTGGWGAWARQSLHLKRDMRGIGVPQVGGSGPPQRGRAREHGQRAQRGGRDCGPAGTGCGCRVTPGLCLADPPAHLQPPAGSQDPGSAGAGPLGGPAGVRTLETSWALHPSVPLPLPRRVQPRPTAQDSLQSPPLWGPGWAGWGQGSVWGGRTTSRHLLWLLVKSRHTNSVVCLGLECVWGWECVWGKKGKVKLRGRRWGAHDECTWGQVVRGSVGTA